MINEFRGETRWLSNFVGQITTRDGRVWPTVEHAYQASKTKNRAEQEAVRACATPGKAKRMGRKVTMREDWDKVKLGYMRYFTSLKYTQNEDLADRLRGTGTQELVEGNTWNDTFWGVCKGVGQNQLGKAIMLVRNNL